MTYSEPGAGATPPTPRPHFTRSIILIRRLMGPPKKPRPNPKAAEASEPHVHIHDVDGPPPDTPDPGSRALTASEASAQPSSTASLADSAATTPVPASDRHAPESSSKRSGSSTPRRSWYGGKGSWRSKAPPIAKIVKESIRVSGGATSELPGAPPGQAAAEKSPAKFLTKRKSSKGDAIPASMTKLNVTSGGSVDPPDQGTEQSSTAVPEAPSAADEPPLPPDPPATDASDDRDTQTINAGMFGWRSWWSRPDGYAESNPAKDKTDMADAQETPLLGVSPLEPSKPPGDVVDKVPSENAKEPRTLDSPENHPGNTVAHPPTQGRSWFWLWSRDQNAHTDVPPAEPPVNPDKSTVTDEPSQSAQAPETSTVEPEAAPLAAAEPTQTPAKPRSSGWAFWSREKPKQDEPSEPHKQVGEIAVSDTPSQSHPEAAQYNEEERLREPRPRSLRGRVTKELDKQASKLDTITKSHSETSTPVESSTPQLAAKQPQKAKQEPNLLLPEFHNTYRLLQKPSYWQQIRQYFLGGEPAIPHLHINPSPPPIKKAIAIGVHGYFPAPLIQKVLGQPTGTSVRFANAAAAAIQNWADAHEYSIEVEKVALEGEGFISDRVKTLWKLLLNWIDEIKAADFILIAAHSQGVPVAIMLLAKLIHFGCVNAARVGVCCMAGVNLGPFAEYKSRYLGATATELFEFSQPKSLVSQTYMSALDEVLRHGVRIMYVGSIDDQLVSLEVSIFPPPSRHFD